MSFLAELYNQINKLHNLCCCHLFSRKNHFEIIKISIERQFPNSRFQSFSLVAGHFSTLDVSRYANFKANESFLPGFFKISNQIKRNILNEVIRNYNYYYYYLHDLVKKERLHYLKRHFSW